MELRYGSRETMEQQAAESIADILRQRAAENGFATIAVPGGRSVVGVFNALSRCDSDWSKIHLFQADERYVPLDSAERNFLLVEKHLLGAFRSPDQNSNILNINLHPFLYDQAENDGGVEDYNQEYKNVLIAYAGESQEISGVRGFDVVLLGAGEDGHVASLFPNHPSITNPGNMFIQIDNSPKPPSKRMSMSRALIERSYATFLFFFGESKKTALSRFFNDSVTPEVCPAKIVMKNEKTLIITDQHVDR